MKQWGMSLAFLGVCFLAAVEGGGPPRREDVPKYLKMLKSADAGERAEGARMLGRRGAISRKDVEAGLPTLRKMLQEDTAAAARAAAAAALGNIGADPKGTVPLLRQALKEKEYQVKMAAIGALSQYRNDAVSALPELRKIAQEKTDKKLSLAARTAIKTIMGK